MVKLTEKQKRFADEYVRTGNISESYRNAYPNITKDNSASAAGSRLLRNVKVRAYIDERLAELKKDAIAEQDEIMQFLTSIMRGEVKESMPLLDGEGYQKVVEVVPNAQARKAAAELLGKRYAMWTDRQQVEGVQQVVIVNDLDD